MNFNELRASSMFVTKPEPGIPEVLSGIQFQNEDMSFQVMFPTSVDYLALVYIMFNVVHFWKTR